MTREELVEIERRVALETGYADWIGMEDDAEPLTLADLDGEG